MLRVESLTCRYGKITAVSELSLEVHKGELVTLIGANGAGKTTTLKAISGLVTPAGGRLIFEGHSAWPMGQGSAWPRSSEYRGCGVRQQAGPDRLGCAAARRAFCRHGTVRGGVTVGRSGSVR